MLASIFEKLNEDAPQKQGPSNAKIITLPENDKKTEKIEFDVKVATSSKTSIFSGSDNKLPAKVESKDEPNKNNIYFQVSFELFTFKKKTN